MNLDDSVYLVAAGNWLRLGDWSHAAQELDAIGAEHQADPSVLDLRWRVYLQGGMWNHAFTAANLLCHSGDGGAEVFIARSHSARQMKGGSLREAYDLLLEAADKFADEPAIPYAIACHACQLGRLAESHGWWSRAREIATRLGTLADWKRRALREPDLQPLWKASAL
jgi:uncharacterized protein HemY